MGSVATATSISPSTSALLKPDAVPVITASSTEGNSARILR